jgi:flavin-dependent dehydrogenase
MKTKTKTKTIAIIGGGPAGATAAERLASGWTGPGVAAVRVLLFEERFGWEKPCGGGLPPKALRRYPFLAEATEAHTAIRDVELVAANGALDGASVRLRLREPLAIYSRTVLNGLLLRRAEATGAEIVRDRIVSFERADARDGTPIHRDRQGEGTCHSGGRPPVGPTGWRLKGREGSYAADYLILAAGARSRLRGLVAEPFPARDFMLTFGHYLPARDTLLRVQFFEDFEGYAWSFPRSDHLSLGICGKARDSTMPELRQRLHGFASRFGYAYEGAPVFSHLLPALTTESWDDLRLAGNGWALTGDAGGLVDPVTGEGIYFAMRSGELLAEALLAGAPETYPERVWRDFGRRLALGSRLAHLFYHDDFLGAASTTRLVQFAVRSRTFMALLEDLIDGSQTYAGLAGRLYRSLGRALVEWAARFVQSDLPREVMTEN